MLCVGLYHLRRINAIARQRQIRLGNSLKIHESHTVFSKPNSTTRTPPIGAAPWTTARACPSSKVVVAFMTAPTGAHQQTAAGLPSGVPPPERARQRVGLKVDRLLRSAIWLLLLVCDLRHAPPRPFGLRPSASRIDTNCAYAQHEHLRFSVDTSIASSRQERS